MNQYKVSCRDMGVECSFSADGRTPEDVKTKLYAHAQKDHGSVLRSMTDMQRIEMDNKMNMLLMKQASTA